jgi:pyruvate dehydrogenase E2 component (dihydrolipoamide acetyltransferase)
VGQPETQYRFRGREPYVAAVLAVTLTCDHRVIDGATGARWLECLKGIIEAPDAWAH